MYTRHCNRSEVLKEVTIRHVDWDVSVSYNRNISSLEPLLTTNNLPKLNYLRVFVDITWH
jgi:hypothetical protein